MALSARRDDLACRQDYELHYYVDKLTSTSDVGMLELFDESFTHATQPLVGKSVPLVHEPLGTVKGPGERQAHSTTSSRKRAAGRAQAPSCPLTPTSTKLVTTGYGLVGLGPVVESFLEVA